MVHLTRAKNVREVGPMRHRHQGEQGGEVRNAGAKVALPVRARAQQSVLLDNEALVLSCKRAVIGEGTRQARFTIPEALLEEELLLLQPCQPSHQLISYTESCESANIHWQNRYTNGAQALPKGHTRDTIRL